MFFKENNCQIIKTNKRKKSKEKSIPHKQNKLARKQKSVLFPLKVNQNIENQAKDDCEFKRKSLK